MSLRHDAFIYAVEFIAVVCFPLTLVAVLIGL